MTSEKISVDLIKKLRELTGVGMQDAQIVLQEAGGDLTKAHELLRRKGIAVASKKSTRTTRQGTVESYVHGGKVGVLVEVNCETDFVAKNPDFKSFVHDIALQIAGTAPKYISRPDVPASLLEKERSIAREQMAGQKKPEAVLEKIIAGKLEKFYEENCLLDQATIKNSDITVGQLLTDAISKFGENIVISRFVRYQLGEGQG